MKLSSAAKLVSGVTLLAVPTVMYGYGAQGIETSLLYPSHKNCASMESFKIRVGRPITPEQLEELSDEQLVRLVPKAYREFFPGKDFCADGHFYLHDGTAWCFFRGGFLDE